MERARILVVDDEADVRDLLQEVLELEGYVVATAIHGAAALDDLRANPATKLVLLDLMMPVMNGWRFCETVRAEPGIAAIPIIVLSAVNQHMPHAPPGATLSMAKPIELQQLVAMIAALLPRPACP